VQLLRATESGLKEQYSKRVGKEAMFTVHGNRFLAHEVLRRLPVEDLSKPELDLEPLTNRVRVLTPTALDCLIQATNELYPDSYLASLFKNLKKCKALDDRIDELWPSDGTLDTS
jgi:hypothetical protein